MVARLKVLLGAVQTMMLSSGFATLWMVVCSKPGMMMSKCISSLTMRTLYSRQMSHILVSSAALQTRPTGLWGLQRSSILLFSSAQSFSNRSKSMIYVLSLYISGQRATLQPWPSIAM